MLLAQDAQGLLRPINKRHPNWLDLVDMTTKAYLGFGKQAKVIDTLVPWRRGHYTLGLMQVIFPVNHNTLNTYLYLTFYVCIYIYILVYIHMRVHTICTHMHVHVHSYTYIYAATHTYTYTCTYMYTYTHIHTCIHQLHLGRTTSDISGKPWHPQ